MKINSEEFWTQRYENKETGWDLGQVSPPLKEYIDQLKNKDLKILIPGGGNSYEAEYLFKNGFKNVTVIDISPLPLQILKNRLPEFPRNQLLQQDYFELQEKYDLILEQTFFCALPPSLRYEYVVKMHSLLNFNGKIAGLLFNREFEKDGPPFGGNEKEYQQLFQKYFQIEILENSYNSIDPRKGNELFFIFKKLN